MEINLNYPTSWEEVTREHLLIIAEHIIKRRTREEFLLEVFCKLTGIRIVLNCAEHSSEYKFAKGRKKFNIPLSTIRTACEELSFLLEKTGLPESPILSVGTKLHGISFRQYYFANAYFHRYQQTQEQNMMEQMHQALTGRKAHKISAGEVMAISIWWSGVQSFLKERYPGVFSDQEGEQTGSTPADTLQEILSALNNNKPQENENILNSDMHAVLHALQHLYNQQKNDNS